MFTKDRDELISVYNQTEYSNRSALCCRDPDVELQGRGLTVPSHSEELFNAIQIAANGTRKDPLSR